MSDKLIIKKRLDDIEFQLFWYDDDNENNESEIMELRLERDYLKRLLTGARHNEKQIF